MKQEINEISKSIAIPDEHKTIVRKRIKNSKSNELLDWGSIKNDFDGVDDEKHIVNVKPTL